MHGSHCQLVGKGINALGGECNAGTSAVSLKIRTSGAWGFWGVWRLMVLIPSQKQGMQPEPGFCKVERGLLEQGVWVGMVWGVERGNWSLRPDYGPEQCLV